MNLLGQLSQHISRKVNDDVRVRARLHLLDWLACVAGARQSPVANVLRKTHLSAAHRASWLGGVLEMDDIHRTALVHPGPVIWGAALRASDDANANIFSLLDGAVRGYEAMIALGESLDAHHYQYFHPTATAGAIGAAAAAGSIIGLDNDQLISAISNAASTTGGLWQMRHEAGMTKQWHIATAANNGYIAAQMAQAGLTGTASILEGSQGLYAALTQQPKPMTFPDPWRIHAVSFKPWAACRHAHPVIDCALELRAKGQLSAPFHIETYADAIHFCDRPNPITEMDAKFSLQHALAVIADGRHAEPADFTTDAINSLAPLRAQITLSESPSITARYPQHFGTSVNGFALIDTRGDPERPVAQSDIITKMRSLAAWGGLPSSEADRAIDLALWGKDTTVLNAMLAEWLA